MKLYARLIAMLCALVMLVAAFAACAETGTGNTTTGGAETVDPGETGPATHDKDGYLLDDLPENLNYKQETVTILYWIDAERAEFDILEEEADGDMVKDAIYKRNITTEDRLGVTFEWIGQKGNSGNRGAFTNYVGNALSGGTYYDIIATYSRTAGMLLVNGYIQDLNKIENSYINTDKPWYPKTMLDACSIRDSLYFVSGDISTNVLHFMYAVYYNLDMFKDLQLDDPIAKVDNKTWTLDEMINLTKDIYVDLDQDGSESVGDRYGFTATYYHLDALYTGSGLTLVEQDTDDILKISDDFFGTTTVDLVDKLGAWFKTGDTYVNPQGGNKGDYAAPFEDGNALFCLNRVYMADNEYDQGALRNADFEYGILPVPLYNEEQDNYITVVGNPFTLWCVMEKAKDPSMSTAVIECFGSEGYRKTSPALFENNMKYRYTPDDAGKGDSARMFDIIRETIFFDLGRILGDSLSYMSEFPSIAAAKSISWSTVSTQYKKSLGTCMKKLNKSLDEVID
ncbi:MAG: ABC transporter substrate-binding protein [Eubacteriales bacterium]